MNPNIKTFAAGLVAVTLCLWLAACGRPETSSANKVNTLAKSFKICPGPEATKEALIAFFDAREGDTIEFCEGKFDLTTGLIVTGKRGITVRGAGKDKTILSFVNSDSSEGINVNHVDGITIEDLTVEDTPGNSIRVFKSKFVTLRRVRAQWTDYKTCSTDPTASNSCAKHGAYALYPVQCRHVLIEDSEAYGSSDAGVYVGQSSDIIVRRTRAEYNVAGFEFENTYRAEFVDNVATNNVGGFLVFDLPGLSQYGEKNLIHRNKSFHNNLNNFAPIGNIVGSTPRGTGMLVLATDQLEIYDNEIYDNDTLGIAVVNYGLVDTKEADLRYDFFPEGIHIHNNVFRDNGGNPQTPDSNRSPSSDPTNNATLLPSIIIAKNNGHSAHIIWDGGVDEPNNCTNYPKDKDGIPLNQSNPNEHGQADRYEARTDERGRPNYQGPDPGPDCGKGVRYNAWKFDANGKLKAPENSLCIEDNNQFSSTTPQTAAVNPFVNAKFSTADPTDPRNQQPGDTNIANYKCSLPARPAPVLKLPFVPDPNSDDARPTEAEVAAACGATKPGQVNLDALLKYNCPVLQQYGLFANPEDPRKDAIGGVPFEMNSALFSDYASKYRFMFLPPGTQAKYKDHTSGITATLDFPVGTVFAKTFSFKNGANENVVETRLLIKRTTASGVVSWIGLPYLWRTGADGKRVAELAIGGAKVAVSYDYDDADADVKDAAGKRVHYKGSVAQYGIPPALSCITCHGGDNRESGAAPIGPKPRNLNRIITYPDGTSMNQLAYLKMHGLLTGLPDDLGTVERLPRWNVPGDSGKTAGSSEDIHLRVRAYLEINCMHCHNSGGAASNSGLYLDSFRPVDVRYGICKRPIAAGKGSGSGRSYDIVPKSANTSILPYRLGSAEAGVRMPPVARTVVQGEAVNLLTTWIDSVLPTSDTRDDTCSGAAGALPVTPPASALPKSASQVPLSPDQRAAGRSNE